MDGKCDLEVMLPANSLERIECVLCVNPERVVNKLITQSPFPVPGFTQYSMLSFSTRILTFCLVFRNKAITFIEKLIFWVQ